MAVRWSPHRADELLVAGAGARLFKVVTTEPKFHCRLDEDFMSSKAENPSQFPLQLMAANCNEALLQSSVVDWYPGSSPDDAVVAVGQRSGTVTITGVDASTSLGAGLANRRDYSPRIARPCSQIAFNPSRSNLLAVGLDKMNKEPSLLLWDISAKSISLSDTKRRLPGASVEGSHRSAKSHAHGTGSARTAGPIELSVGEAVLSLTWMPDNPDILLAGIGSKWLRLFDIRAGSTHTVSTARGAYSLTVDRNAPNVFASFSKADHAIKIWDMRQFSEPVLTLPTNRQGHVSKLAWCPTRPGLLGALFDNDCEVQLYDTRHRENTELEAWSNKPITRRKALHQHDEPLTHFDWHPTIRNRLITISKHAIAMSTAPEPVACDISASGVLCSGSVGSLEFYGTKTIKTSPSDATITDVSVESKSELQNPIPVEDISAVMHRRAIKGYHATTIEQNIAICTSEPEVCAVWSWLHSIEGDLEMGTFGVRDALSLESENHLAQDKYSRAYACTEGAFDIAIHDTTLQRGIALSLCGWVAIGDEVALDKKLAKLELAGEYERAAAVAVFHQDIARAIKCLTCGASERGESETSGMLSAAISLSGYSATAHKMAGRPVPFGAPRSSDSLWVQTCRQLIPKCPSTALRAALKFLTQPPTEYDVVLAEEALDLPDRIGFACRYLPDDKLSTFLDIESQRALTEGALEGLLIEGFSARGIDIIGSYVDRTADVQTAAVLTSAASSLIATNSSGSQELSSEPRVELWLQCYRDLLDQWELFIERAKFDVDRSRLQGTRVGPQVYVRCTYCNTSVIPTKTFRGGPSTLPTTLLQMRGSTARSRTTMACPSCRRPLPRCSVCLTHLGTATQGMVPNATPAVGKLQRFGRWASWCPKCRHGGHAECLANWFAKFSTCPVSGCSCTCSMVQELKQPGEGSIDEHEVSAHPEPC